MREKLLPILFLISISCGTVLNVSASSLYPWTESYSPSASIASRIPAPENHERIPVSENSFQDWLRNLPLKPGKSTVYLFDGQKKRKQNVHVAVVDIDIGNRDLQQCADAIIRLRAEYLYARGKYGAIRFNFTSGDTASYLKWRQGYRPMVRGNRVKWRKSRGPDSSYAAFHSYLQTVFMYAGSHSLERELVPVKDVGKMRIGDIFIQGGFPGHAVIVVDMAIDRSTGNKIFILAQSYMPAQNIHILANPAQLRSNPWYETNFGKTLRTPEWIFQRSRLNRFKPLD